MPESRNQALSMGCEVVRQSMLPLKLYAFEIVLALDLIIGSIVLNFAPGRYAGAALQGSQRKE